MNTLEDRIPWSKINDFLLEVGAEREPQAFCTAVLRRLSVLVPYDSGILFLIDRPARKVEPVSIGVEDGWSEAYLEYYSKVDRGQFSFEVADIGEVRWSDYKDTEYVTDFVRPQRYEYSATIKFFSADRDLVGAMALNRSGSGGFSDEEKNILRVLRPHLVNLHANMFVAAKPEDFRKPSDLFKPLTKRETEILGLLCRGLGPEEVGRRLFVSRRTVEKHLESLYRKCGVASRQNLIVKAFASELKERSLTSGRNIG